MALAFRPWTVTATATNALATATKAAVAGKRHYLTAVVASYGAATAAGLLQVKKGSTVILEHYLKDTLPFVLDLSKTPIETDENEAVSAELAAGGVGAVGKVNLVGRTE